MTLQQVWEYFKKEKGYFRRYKDYSDYLSAQKPKDIPAEKTEIEPEPKTEDELFEENLKPIEKEEQPKEKFEDSLQGQEKEDYLKTFN